MILSYGAALAVAGRHRTAVLLEGFQDGQRVLPIGIADVNARRLAGLLVDLDLDAQPARERCDGVRVITGLVRVVRRHARRRVTDAEFLDLERHRVKQVRLASATAALPVVGVLVALQDGGAAQHHLLVGEWLSAFGRHSPSLLSGERAIYSTIFEFSLVVDAFVGQEFVVEVVFDFDHARGNVYLG